MSDFPPNVIENILADLDESVRLKQLSNEELVMECIQHAETDCPIVDEMCERLIGTSLCEFLKDEPSITSH